MLFHRHAHRRFADVGLDLVDLIELQAGYVRATHRGRAGGQQRDLTAVAIKDLTFEQAINRVSVVRVSAPTVANRLAKRLVNLLRLRQRAPQYPRAMPGMEAARQVGFDRGKKALAAAARAVPKCQ